MKQIVRRHRSPQALVQRVRVILRASQGMNNTEISQELNLARNTVRTWRQRWLAYSERLMAIEAQDRSEKEWTDLLMSILADTPRAGTPATFSTEQVVQIVALACETPEKSQRPVSHWTAPDLAQEAIKRGIVKSISPRSVGRFLKRGDSTTPSQSLLAQCSPR